MKINYRYVCFVCLFVKGRENTELQSPKVPETVKSSEMETPTSAQTLKSSARKGMLDMFIHINSANWRHLLDPVSP